MSVFRSPTFPAFLVAILIIGFNVADARGSPSREQTEFFESKVRPILVEHCYECHSVDAKRSKPDWFSIPSGAGKRVATQARRSFPATSMKAC